MATFHLAPGYTKYHAFCAQADINDEEEDTNPIILDTQATYHHDQLATLQEDPALQPADLPDKPGKWEPVNSKPVPVIIEDEEERQSQTMSAELLKYHYKFAHAPFKKLQKMASQGVIPTRLAKCPHPVCTACMYGKATRRQWRQKTSSNRDEATTPTQPRQVVSVDQMVSPTPGLIAQLTGKLTTK